MNDEQLRAKFAANATAMKRTLVAMVPVMRDRDYPALLDLAIELVREAEKIAGDCRALEIHRRQVRQREYDRDLITPPPPKAPHQANESGWNN